MLRPGPSSPRTRRSFRREQARNRRRVVALLGFFLALVGGAGWLAGSGFERLRDPESALEGFVRPATPPWRDYRFLLAGTTLLLGVVQVLRIRRTAGALVLGLVDARPLRERQLENVAQEMAIAAGLPAPRIFLVDDPTPNAFACGWDAESASVAVTRGLLELLDRDELQGVLAHEIGHIRAGDTRVATLLVGLTRAVHLLVPFALGGILAALVLGAHTVSEEPEPPPSPAPAPAAGPSPSPAGIAALVLAMPFVAVVVLAASIVVSLTLTLLFALVLALAPFLALAWLAQELWWGMRRGPDVATPHGDAAPVLPGRIAPLLLLVPGGLVLGLPILLVGIVAPAALPLLRLAVQRGQELRADADAVALTRNPAGLVGALRKLKAHEGGRATLPRALAPLCIAPLRAPTPSEDAPLADLLALVRGWLSSHPPLEERIRRLEAMW